MTPRRIPATILLVLVTGWSATRADQPSPRDRYFDGLRQRGLFSLAEGVCFQELAQADLPPDLRLDSTLQLSRTLVEHAQTTGGPQQQDLWNRARTVLDEFNTLLPKHPGRLRVSVQSALIPLAHGGYLARLADLAPLDRRRRGQALDKLQSGINQLSPLQQRLENPGSLKNHRRRLLLATTRWRLARAHLDRARMMTPGTPDRAADLIAAATTLKRMSPAALGDQLQRSRTRLLAEISRQQLDFAMARRILAPANVAEDDALLAERVWIELDDQKPDRAVQLVETRLARPPPPSDELLFLAQASLARLWQVTSTTTAAARSEDLWTRWLAASKRAIAVPTAYWRTRAIQDRDLLAAIQQLGPELAQGQHRAISLYQAERIEEALDAFTKVIRTARETDRPQLAGDLAFTRGSVMVRAGRFASAVKSFRAVADQKPVHRQAASAHLLWAWCLGQVERKQPTTSHRMAYHRALVQHRTRFPDDPTTGEATWLLASLEQQLQHDSLARTLWMKIPASHPRAASARRLVAESLERELAGLARDDPNRGKQLDTAIRDIKAMVTQLPQPPGSWTTDQASLVLSLARLSLKRPRPDYPRVDALLEMALTRGPTVNGETPSSTAVTLRDTARQLRVLSLAGQGRLDDARKLIATFAERPADLLALLDGLDRVAVTTRPSDRRRLGELQLQAAQTLDTQRQQLDQGTIDRLDHCLAQAYVAAGLPLRAISLYEQLVKNKPRDWKLRSRMAAIRMSIGSADQLQAAVTDWQTAERLLAAGTNEWMSVRLGTLRSLKLAGRLKQFRQLLKLTRLLYPGKGTAAVQADLKRLDGQPPQPP